MSELTNLLGKRFIQVNFLGKEIKVKPIGVDLMPDLLNLEDDKKKPEEKTESIIRILKSVLSYEFPGVTEDEIKQIPVEEVNKLLEQLGNGRKSNQ